MIDPDQQAEEDLAREPERRRQDRITCLVVAVTGWLLIVACNALLDLIVQ